MINLNNVCDSNGLPLALRQMKGAFLVAGSVNRSVLTLGAETTRIERSSGFSGKPKVSLAPLRGNRSGVQLGGQKFDLQTLNLRFGETNLYDVVNAALKVEYLRKYTLLSRCYDNIVEKEGQSVADLKWAAYWEKREVERKKRAETLKKAKQARAELRERRRVRMEKEKVLKTKTVVVVQKGATYARAAARAPSLKVCDTIRTTARLSAPVVTRAKVCPKARSPKSSSAKKIFRGVRTNLLPVETPVKLVNRWEVLSGKKTVPQVFRFFGGGVMPTGTGEGSESSEGPSTKDVPTESPEPKSIPEKVIGSAFETNPEGHDPTKISDIGNGSGSTEGSNNKDTDSGASADAGAADIGVKSQSLLAEAVKMSLPQFAGMENKMVASSDYAVTRLPSLYTLSNLGALLCDMPTKFTMEQVGEDFGTKYSIQYRWSDGTFVKEYTETMISEEIDVAFYYKEEGSRIPGVEASYLHSVDIKPSVKEALYDPLEQGKLARTIRAVLGGRDDNATFKLLQGYAGLLDSGDNHISYLINMCRYFLSALVTSACGGNYDMKFNMKERRCHFVEDSIGWWELMAKEKGAPVACRNRDIDYAHFLTICTYSGVSKYPSWLENRSYINMYDSINLGWNTEMYVASVYDLDPNNHGPRWVGDPARIKGYIEMYCKTCGLHQQLNEAYKIATLLPEMSRISAGISIPEPIHTSDVFSSFIEADHKRSLLTEAITYGPARQIMTCHMTISMVKEAMTSFTQGFLYERDSEEVTADVVKAFIYDLQGSYADSKVALLNLISKITGIDLSFWYQIGGDTAIMDGIVSKVIKPSAPALFKMLLMQVPEGSIAWSLRRGLTMVSENVNSPHNRVSYELSKVLNSLGYSDGAKDVTGRFDYLPYCTSDRRKLVLHPQKKLYFWAMKDKVCKLKLETINFNNVQAFEPEIDGETAEDVVKSFLTGLLREGPRSNRGTTLPTSFEGKFQPDPTRQNTPVKPIKKGYSSVTYEVPEYMKGKIDQESYLRWAKDDKENVHLSFDPTRMATKERTAASLYIQNQRDHQLAKTYFNLYDWMALSNMGGGDCGPLSFNQAMSMSGQQTPPLAVSTIRDMVASEQGLQTLTREWWSDSDLTVAGSLFNKTIIVEIVNKNKQTAIVMVYKGEEEPPIVLRCTDNMHFECLVAGQPGLRPLVLSEEDKRKDSSGKNNPRRFYQDYEGQGYKLAIRGGGSGTSHNGKPSGGTLSSWKSMRRAFKHLNPQEFSWLEDFRAAKDALIADCSITIPTELILSMKDEQKEWDEHEYSREEKDLLTSPVITEDIMLKNILPGIPIWVVYFRQLYTKHDTWNLLKQYHIEGHIPTSLVRVWHMVLWPFLTVPLDIQIVKQGVWMKQGCGCFACNVVSKRWICPEAGENETLCSHQRLEKIVTQQPDRDVFKILKGAPGYSMNMVDRKSLNALFPFSHSVGARKANMDVGTLMAIYSTKKNFCPKMWKFLRQFLRNRTGGSNNMVSALLVWIVGNTLSPGGHIMANWMGVLGCCTAHWIEHFKGIHDQIRSRHQYAGYHLQPSDHSQLLYLHLLYGRMGLEVEWEEEKKKRTRKRTIMKSWKDGIWSASQWDEDVRRAIDRIVSRLQKPKKRFTTLREYWDERWGWMASGSATGKGRFLDGDTASQVVGEEISKKELNNNKRAVSEKMSFQEIIDTLNSAPIQKAYSHTKANELAKTRSIFGVEMEHYVLHNYMCQYIEPSIRDKRIAIREESARGFSELLERMSWAEQKKELNSFDFTDFNDQHELITMKYLHDSLTTTLVGWYAREEGVGDIEQVGRWIANSFMDQRALDPTTNSYYRWSGGMFSGNRATTLINTILNQAYTDVVRLIIERRYGRDPISESFHTGDDIVMVCKSHGENLLFNQVATEVGLEANPAKQLNDKGIMEYLRLTYYPNGEVLGSLARSIGTFINGNWESEVEVEPLARAQACWDQCSVLLRRGLRSDYAQLYFKDLLKYYSRTKTRNSFTAALSLEVAERTVETGGLGLGRLGEGTLLDGPILPKVRSEGKMKLDCSKIEKSLKGTQAYLDNLNVSILPKWAKIRKKDRPRAVNFLAESTIGLELPRRLKCDDAYVAQIASLNKSSQDSTEVIKSTKVKKLTSVVDAVGEMNRIVGQQQYVKKMEVLYPLLSYDQGYSEKDMKMKIEKEAGPYLEKLEKKVNRYDGGRVPPHLQSILALYAKINNVDLAPYYNYVLQDEVMQKIRY
nr:MAG: RNA-dependent RNA polymerase [XiangYun toti-like virus 3]